MRAEGVSEDTAIVMAGGVWFLREWEEWIDNPELGKIAFQFGTRPLLTKESPIPNVWKDMLRTVEPGDVLLHKFSPTGFYSSAVKTPFLYDLMHRSERQIPIFKRDEEEDDPARRSRQGEIFLRPSRRPAQGAGVDSRGLHRGAQDARQHRRVRDPRKRRTDPRRPAGLHGLPLALPVLKLEGS